ncbi:FAD-dependent oxidoreductase [Coraliomargarita parva]|uniref:FAD-dependent oxidoreductase n=1 Tax=Coraliomargarita parva TaxID=3014050 RepID=UPI0022B5209E|nr:FAD-dependent oxidoreductase [Coraliomargarita parva]
MPKAEHRNDPDTKPLVIVGNGMASWRLCRKLVEHGVHENRRIIVYGEERLPAYDRVNLTRYFGLESPEELLLSPAEWYGCHEIDLRTGTRIIKLDTNLKVVVDSDGREISYGDCVLATGSRPFVPPIPGGSGPGVFVYRTTDDIESIKAAAGTARRGLVIGGGLLGLEAANVLKDLDVKTTIVQASSGLMSRQLDEDAAGYLLREVAELGMSVLLRTQTTRIESDDGGVEVHFEKHDPMRVDLVIVATGIVPRDDLAVGAGLPTAARGGIIVNDKLEAAAPHVFAIGECASHRGQVYGLVAPAYEMADLLAARFAGHSKLRYQGSDNSCRLKLFGVEVGTFGDYLQEGRYHVYRGERSYRSIVTRGRKLIGATVVGDWDQTAELERAVREGRTLKIKAGEKFERTGALFEGEGATSVLSWPDHALVCNCTRTSCGMLKTAVAGGCRNVAELTKVTGAGGVCGSCLPQLAGFFGDEVKVSDFAKPKGMRLLWGASVVGLLACLCLIFIPPLPAAETVQGWYYAFTGIWRDSLSKQISGFTIAGFSLLALVLSARKRFRWLNVGNYGFWRAAHSWLGICTIVGIFLHTGLNFGENLNLWLLACFLGLNLAGGLAALAVAAEKHLAGEQGARLRALATKAHIIFFLPYPVLLGFHIAKVYLY